MGKRVKCPRCGDEFHVHGSGTMPGDELVTCYNCGCMFNHRKQSDVPESNT